jgi:hypothetical protein
MSRRRWQFGLRALLALTALVAVVFGAWRAYVEPYRREARVAAHVQSLGGRVTMEPAGPKWLRWLMGDERCRAVTAIDLSPYVTGGTGSVASTDVGDVALTRLRGLRHLRSLDLSETDVTDEGLARLAQLKTLEELLLAETKVTDAGVATLCELKSLRWLSLQHGKITDASLDHLAELPNLEVACLHQTQVTADGLRRLSVSRPKLYIQCCSIAVVATSVKMDDWHAEDAYLEVQLPVVTFQLRNLAPHAIRVEQHSRGELACELQCMSDGHWRTDVGTGYPNQQVLAGVSFVPASVEGVTETPVVVRVCVPIYAAQPITRKFYNAWLVGDPVTVTGIKY